MNEKRQIIPFAGLVATIAVAAYMVVQLNGQEAPTGVDFSGAANARGA